MNTRRGFMICAITATVTGCNPPPPEQLANLPVVATGFNTTCVMGPRRGLSCWGFLVGDTVLPLTAHTSPVTPVGIGEITGIALTPSRPLGCVVRDDPAPGSVWCWKEGETASHVPISEPVLNVSVGGPGPCVVTATRSVRCWSVAGFGSFASSLYSSTPSSVQGLPERSISQVSMGKEFACALSLTNEVWCWGSNSYGQLARGTLDNNQSGAQAIGNLRASQISAGMAHACAKTMEGAIRCWGSNDQGQLGNAARSDVPSTTPQAVVGITNALMVAAGASFTCATLSDETARCWGWNNSKRLGIGTQLGTQTDGSIGPVVVEFLSAPKAVSGLTGVRSISAGSTHACATGLGTAVHCWGDNSAGQLTDGTTKDSSVPVPK
jgi:alpha-tubulin suppressor-like RCC1 family protein